MCDPIQLHNIHDKNKQLKKHCNSGIVLRGQSFSPFFLVQTKTSWRSLLSSQYSR